MFAGLRASITITRNFGRVYNKLTASRAEGKTPPHFN